MTAENQIEIPPSKSGKCDGCGKVFLEEPRLPSPLMKVGDRWLCAGCDWAAIAEAKKRGGK